MYDETGSPKVTQLPSRYFLKEGKHFIEYSFKVEGFFYFTDLAILWEGAFGTKIVNLNDHQNVASFCEETTYRAVKYSEQDLDFIFKNLVVFGQVKYKNPTLDKYKVERY